MVSQKFVQEELKWNHYSSQKALAATACLFGHYLTRLSFQEKFDRLSKGTKRRGTKKLYAIKSKRWQTLRKSRLIYYSLNTYILYIVHLYDKCLA